MWLRKAYLAFHRRANARALNAGVTADQFVLLSVVAREPGIAQITIVQWTASDPNTGRRHPPTPGAAGPRLQGSQPGTAGRAASS